MPDDPTLDRAVGSSQGASPGQPHGQPHGQPDERASAQHVPQDGVPPLPGIDPARIGFIEADQHAVSGKRGSRCRRALALLLSDTASTALAASGGWLLHGMLQRVSTADPVVAGALPDLSVAAVAIGVCLPLGIIIVCSAARGHYTRFRPVWVEALEITRIVSWAAAGALAALFVTGAQLPLTGFVLCWACLLLLVPLSRVWCKRHLMRVQCWYRPAVIVGAVDAIASARQAVEGDPFLGQRVVGFVSSEIDDLDDLEQRDQLRHYSLWMIDELEHRYGRLEIICAPDSANGMATFNELINDWLLRTSTITVAPRANGLPLYGATTISLFTSDTILLQLNSNLGNWWGRRLKRSFDLVVSVALLMLLAPVFVVIALLVRRDGGPLFFGSERVGRDGLPFQCLKFRSMVPEAQQVLAQHLATHAAARVEWERFFKLTDDPRITPIGRMMRQSSLDELPQLFNVIRGEMSLVGPRPILPEEVPTYGDYLRLYYMARPGITGLWQVCGRSTLAQAERVQLNAWYVRNWSLWTDIVILLKTVPATLRGSGAS